MFFGRCSFSLPERLDKLCKLNVKKRNLRSRVCDRVPKPALASVRLGREPREGVGSKMPLSNACSSISWELARCDRPSPIPRHLIAPIENSLSSREGTRRGTVAGQRVESPVLPRYRGSQPIFVGA